MAEGNWRSHSRLAVLNKLAALWEEGKTATVVEVIQAQPQRVPAARTLIDIVEDAPEVHDVPVHVPCSGRRHVILAF